MPPNIQENMSDEMNRGVMVRLRLTPEEHASWLAAAELEQMTLSQWIRRRCMGLAATAPEIVSAKPAKPTKKGAR